MKPIAGIPTTVGIPATPGKNANKSKDVKTIRTPASAERQWDQQRKQQQQKQQQQQCAAGFTLLNLPKGKSLGRSKPETNSYAQALGTHCVGFLLYPSSAELPYAK